MRKVAIPDEGVESLFGTYDENLKHLEDRSSASASARTATSSSSKATPADVARAERVLDQLAGAHAQADTGSRRGTCRRRRSSSRRTRPSSSSDYFLRGATRTSGKRQVDARRASTQRRYLEAIDKPTLSSGSGRPGTGKTYLAMAQAVSFLLAKRVSRIILARPAVEAGEKLGFLPGDLQEKVNPYLRPLYDALYDMIDIERAERLLERGTIEVAPIAFMRGRTLNDAFVILDEAQNTTSEQMKMFLTRLGFGSKAVITGDVTQIDLPIGPRVRASSKR